MPKPLTDLERRVLDYIVEYLRTNTYQPSIREIGREFTIKSTKTVSELLQSLADKGWIERDPSRSRGVRLVGLEMRGETVSVPLYAHGDNGDIAGRYLIDRKLAGSSGAYLIVMEDDHLAEEGVRRGDLMLVDPAATVRFEAGDLIVVRVASGSSVRRCASTNPTVLEPTRVGEAPLTLTPRQVQDSVLGRVAGVIRRLRPLTVTAPLEATPIGS